MRPAATWVWRYRLWRWIGGVLGAALLLAAVSPSVANDDPQTAPESGHAYSECRDGYWWVVSYRQVSDGKGGYTLQKTYDEKTSQTCGGSKPPEVFPPGYSPEEVGPPPEGPCLTAADIKYAKTLRDLYDHEELELSRQRYSLKALMQELAAAQNDPSLHVVEREERVAAARRGIDRLKEDMKNGNARMRFLMQRLAAAQKPPCPGVTDEPPTPPDLPEELPPPFAVPAPPAGACYTNADNLYEAELRRLLAEARKQRDAHYDELGPLAVAEWSLQLDLIARQKDVDAIKPPPGGKTLSVPEQEEKDRLTAVAEAVRAALTANLDQQGQIFLKIQALDLAIAAIEARLKLPPKPPCVGERQGPPPPPPSCPPAKSNDGHVSLPSGGSALTEHVLAGVGVVAPAPACPNRRSEEEEPQPGKPND